MTQQSETEGGGDDGAQDEATDGVRRYGNELLGVGKAAPVRAVGIDPVPAYCPSLQPARATPVEMRADLARFESTFPAFSFMICMGWDGPRIEAWRDITLGGLYAIITDDPGELWRELNMTAR
ncbi:MAG: hypothetical protein ACRDNZ_05020 [Streptosporangiaceae bacterium]